MPAGCGGPGASRSAWPRRAAPGKASSLWKPPGTALSTRPLASPSPLRLPQFQGSRAHEALPEMQQPTQKLGSEMASADCPRLCSAGRGSWHRGLSALALGESSKWFSNNAPCKSNSRILVPLAEATSPPLPNHIPS